MKRWIYSKSSDQNINYVLSFWFMVYSLWFYLKSNEIARLYLASKYDKKYYMKRLHFLSYYNDVRSLWTSDSKQLWWAFVQRHVTEFFFSIIYLSIRFYRVFLWQWWRWQRPISIWFTFSIECYVLYVCFVVKSFYGNCLYSSIRFLRVCILHAVFS